MFVKTNNADLPRLSVTDFKQNKKRPIIIVLDNIRSAHNVGSVFRTADAFLIEAIYLCGYTPTPPHNEIHKTALGATDTVAWQYFNTTMDAVKHLKQNNYYIAAVEQAQPNTLLHNFEMNQATAFIMGSEVGGVSDDIIQNVDVCVEIPQWGSKHSINISVATGIVLWHVLQQPINALPT